MTEAYKDQNKSNGRPEVNSLKLFLNSQYALKKRSKFSLAFKSSMYSKNDERGDARPAQISDATQLLEWV